MDLAEHCPSTFLVISSHLCEPVLHPHTLFLNKEENPLKSYVQEDILSNLEEPSCTARNKILKVIVEKFLGNVILYL